MVGGECNELFGKKNFRFFYAEMWKEDLERVGLGRGKHPRICSPGGACLRVVRKKIS